jgi:deazaflavin-dependent oxidoreductase (nitroreductase family)
VSSWIKFFTTVNVFVYQLTKGYLGSRMGGQSILLLHTVGRKSGKNYTTSLSYYRDGNAYLVVASNWGKEKHPDWFYNLLQYPRATIQVQGTSIAVDAHQAQGIEYKRLWELVTHQNRQYLQYQMGLARQIPVVILTPAISAQDVM